MASNRAFKNLASLKNSFDEPVEEEISTSQLPEPTAQSSPAVGLISTHQHAPAPMLVRSHDSPSHPVSPITGKVDRRRLKKVLKTPSVSLSVAVRAELHEEVTGMLFARKSTWIALLDQLLTAYVSEAKATGHFPK